MAPEEETALRYEITQLKHRLEEMDRTHRKSQEAVRVWLEKLETKLRAASSAPAPAISAANLSEPVPPPLPSVPPITEGADIDERGAPISPELTEPAPVSTLDVSLISPPPPPLPAPPKADASFEMQLGRVWLVRFGIVILITGLVLLGNYAYRNWVHDLPAGLRLFFLYLLSGGLIETGRRLAAKQSTKTPGEVVLGGGLSFFYYCTFAAHHVPRLRVIESPVFASVLLLFSAAAIGAVALWRNSRTVAVLGIVLASYSTMLQPMGWISCVSNVLLAGAGMAVMLKPGWAGPGVASMICTYGAFFGWQLMGAATARGDLRDPAVMWFLPPVWAMFSLPGLLGRFNATLSDRARAWFIGTNNGVFLALFAGLWALRFDGMERFWIVTGILGVLLISMGVIGRRRGEGAGGVNLAQGLSLLCVTLVMKLEGHHLAFALALEAVALGLAFRKYKGRSEMFFSFLCAAGAALVVVWPYKPIPVWSAGLTCLLVMGAWAALKSGASACTGNRALWAHLSANTLYLIAIAATIFGWNARLPGFWITPSLAAIATGMGACAVYPRGSWRLPEARWASLIFLFAAVVASAANHSITSGGLALAAAITLGGTWIWQRGAERAPGDGAHDADLTSLFAWLFPCGVMALAIPAVELARLPNEMALAWGCGLQIGLVLFAMVARCGRLAPVAALLGLPMVYWFLIERPVADASGWIALSSFSATMLLHAPVIRGWLQDELRLATLWILRATTFIAFCVWLYLRWPLHAGDAFAISGMVLMGYAFLTKRPLLEEARAFVSLAAIWLLVRSFDSYWTPVSVLSWRGYLVVAALWMLLAGAKLGRAAKGTREILDYFGPLAAITTSVWATQMLVWRMDWRFTAILWSVLGFIFVSTGLWSGMRAFRIAGLVLLGTALLKIFAMDVWAFRTFGRVASFIVLGIALILLGIFYNKFTSAMKELLVEDGEKEDAPPVS